MTGCQSGNRYIGRLKVERPADIIKQKVVSEGIWRVTAAFFQVAVATRQCIR